MLVNKVKPHMTGSARTPECIKCIWWNFNENDKKFDTCFIKKKGVNRKIYGRFTIPSFRETEDTGICLPLFWNCLYLRPCPHPTIPRFPTTPRREPKVAVYLLGGLFFLLIMTTLLLGDNTFFTAQGRDHECTVVTL